MAFSVTKSAKRNKKKEKKEKRKKRKIYGVFSKRRQMAVDICCEVFSVFWYGGRLQYIASK